MTDEKIKILLLTANPSDLMNINLEKELREIDQELCLGDYRDRVELEYALAARPRDLFRALHRHRPHVVHFSGHGSATGEIFLLSEDDKRHPVPPDALKAVFDAAKDNIRVVFLNSCYSGVQAEAIAEVVESAVGTNAAIEDAAAIVFSRAFYRAVGFGRSIGDAVKEGKAELMTEGIGGQDKVQLIARHDTDPYQLRLFEPTPPMAESTGPSDAATLVPAVRPRAEPIETDPTGRVYIISAPTRMQDARLIASALTDRGVPVWEESLKQNRNYLEDKIQDLLNSPGTSAGILVLTAETADSSFVKGLELPVILDRAKGGPDFFVVAARFPGFGPSQLGVPLPARGVTLQEFTRKTTGPAEAAEIARLALGQRIAAIHKALPLDEALRLELYTLTLPPFRPGTALLLDWTSRFNGRFATREQWDKYLLPSLRDVVETISARAQGRAVQADGRLSLPAAIALGATFIQPRGIEISWLQHTAGRADQLWTIHGPKEECGFTIDTKSHRPDGADVAVLLSAVPSTNIENTFLSTADLPPFRAVIRVWKTPIEKQGLETAGQATDLALKVQNAIRLATDGYAPIRCIHLFMAAPAGLAMMIGQLLNNLPAVQTYDLGTSESGRVYRPAALLNPAQLKD